MKILILDSKSQSKAFAFTKAHLAKIKSVHTDIKVTVLTNPSASLLKKELGDTDILFPTVGIPQTVQSPTVKWIHVASAGVDRLSQELKDSSVIITNSSGVHPIPISEHVLGFMLMFARQLNIFYRTQVKDKKWIKNEPEVFELHGKTVIIVGLGRIGSRVAMLAKAFGMKVLAVSRSTYKKSEFVHKSYKYKDLETILKEADFVVDALPATHETAGMFDKKLFSKMKKSAYFINIGRGKTVNEKDLIEALKWGKIAGAGLDVFEMEPLPANSPLWKLDNVILTPHVSGHTPHYMDRVVDIFYENLRQFLAKKRLPNQIDKQKGY